MADDKSRNASTGAGKAKDDEVVVIKKYANRRLYNTATSAYVTLEDLSRMVREGVEFLVYDARTNEDLTRQILTQIIFEEESRGEALLPVQFLRQLIGFYGNQMQGVLPSYLELSLENFSRQQDQFRNQMTRTFGTGPGANLMEEAVKQNMAMFERALKMFPGFGYMAADGSAPVAPSSAPAAEGPSTSAPDPLSEMKAQMDEMRAQIERLANAGGPGKDKGGA